MFPQRDIHRKVVQVVLGEKRTPNGTASRPLKGKQCGRGKESPLHARLSSLPVQDRMGAVLCEAFAHAFDSQRTIVPEAGCRTRGGERVSEVADGVERPRVGHMVVGRGGGHCGGASFRHAVLVDCCRVSRQTGRQAGRQKKSVATATYLPTA